MLLLQNYILQEKKSHCKSNVHHQQDVFFLSFLFSIPFTFQSNSNHSWVGKKKEKEEVRGFFSLINQN